MGGLPPYVGEGSALLVRGALARCLECAKGCLPIGVMRNADALQGFERHPGPAVVFAWEVLSPSENEELNGSRLALKTVSYGILSIFRSLTLGSLLGGAQIAQSLGFVATYTVLDSILYASTEYLDGFLARSRREWALSIL